MTATPQTYRKKPVEIEARRFLGGGAGPAGGPTPHSTSPTHAIYRWVEKNTLGTFDPAPIIGGDQPWPESGVAIDPRDGRMIIATLEGGRWVNLGDWIIRGVHGEFYPCKPDIFEASYDAVQAEPPMPGMLFVGDEGLSVPVTEEVRRAINDAIAENRDVVMASALRRGVNLNEIVLPHYERVVTPSPLMRNPYSVEQ